MRAFVALELPGDVVEDLVVLARQLQGYVRGRFMRRETYHVTLAFLGEVDESAARRAMDALDAACAGCDAPLLVAEGLGTFGRPHDATLWLGLREVPELMDIAAAVRHALDKAGVVFDRKAFRPHITLARRARLPREPLEGLVFPRQSVATCVTLFKSTLTPDGAIYKPLHRVQLAR
ncbi:RNA 2',3'-cyclic phosphodiesterase [Collinsella sp. An2]|uniref:RNA 2',3'-cyclic phosphodiesterase n=1 Tax=Collinsella sp. An2 TaxID=1965585 RepID=UPI000B39BE8B|nr:RNA 2',3'-cyclic phosphodiesterase [Collinsella sp. An2]OUP09823.1 2'-5' RNA ligase [Collinsella sp. An2]